MYDINMEKLAREGFKIVDGVLCDRFGGIVGAVVRVTSVGWGSPCTEYRFDEYSLRDYTIKKETQYDNWYLAKGYSKICDLYYYGGKNWSTK